MLDSTMSKPIIVDENHMRKHRVMKRKLLQFITTHKEAQAKLDKAVKRIKILEKRNKLLKEKLSRSSNDMDISPTEEEDEDDDDEDDDEDEEEEDELDEDGNVSLYKLLSAHSTIKRLGRRRAPSISEIQRDGEGRPILPIQFGQVKLISLGTINHTDPTFHNERYIWPVGYTVERTYMSMVDAENQTEYICKIEADDEGPLFTIQPKDDPNTILSGRTPTSCWGMVIKGANKVRRKSCRNAISGPEYYGFGNSVIRRLIEELENADKCEKYISS